MIGPGARLRDVICGCLNVLSHTSDDGRGGHVSAAAVAVETEAPHAEFAAEDIIDTFVHREQI